MILLRNPRAHHRKSDHTSRRADMPPRISLLLRKISLYEKLHLLAATYVVSFLLAPRLRAPQFMNPSTQLCRRELSEHATPRDYDDTLVRESSAYEGSSKYVNKIKEADIQWEKPFLTHQGRFGAIHTHTQSAIAFNKEEEMFVLELGFGAGTNMLVVQQQMQRAHRRGH